MPKIFYVTQCSRHKIVTASPIKQCPVCRGGVNALGRRHLQVFPILERTMRRHDKKKALENYHKRMAEQKEQP